MKSIKTIIVLLLSFGVFEVAAERSMYVNDFHNILGDEMAENALLSFAVTRNIETLLLYDLHTVHAQHDLTNTATNQVLADFIYKAKNTYNLTKIGAVAENAWFFTNRIDAYNNTRSNALEKFDIYNLEFEFWVGSSVNSGGYYCTTYLQNAGFTCDNDGAFQFFTQELAAIKTLATNNSHPILTEAYVGWTTATQAATIGSNLDRVLVHAYVANPSTAFSYSSGRLIDFANGNPNLAVSIIFSAEPVFMQNWLLSNDMSTAENTFVNDWTNSSSSWSHNINLLGFTYFAYGFMTNITLPIGLKSFTGKAVNDKILLIWETESEVNSDYFEVQRKGENADFERIESVKAAGNSLDLISYQFTDNSPLPIGNYYRLKQVDLPNNSGSSPKFEYSETILVDFSPKEFITFLPSPSNDILIIQMPNTMNNIAIFNANGQLVEQFKNIETSILNININKLSSGIYYLRWNNEFNTVTKEFFVL